MPLDKAKVQLPLRTALQGDIDERIVPPGALLEAKNCYVDKRSALVKREGFTKLDMTVSTPQGYDIRHGRLLFSSGEELCLASDWRLYALDDQTGTSWLDKGAISPVEVNTEPVDESYGQTRLGRFDTAFSSPYALTAFSVVRSTGQQTLTNASDAGDMASPEGDQSSAIRFVIQNLEEQQVAVTNLYSVTDTGTYVTGQTGTGPIPQSDVFKGAYIRCCHVRGAGPVPPKLICLHQSDQPNGAGKNWDVVWWDAGAPETGWTKEPGAFLDIVAAGTTSLYGQRIDGVGHDGLTATGTFSVAFMTNDTIIPGVGDYVIARYDGAFNLVSSYTLVQSEEHSYYKGTITDDPDNNKTLFAVAWYDSLAGPLRGIDVGRIDHTTGIPDWIHLSALNPLSNSYANLVQTRDVGFPTNAAPAANAGNQREGYDLSIGTNGVFPRTMGVARCRKDDGGEGVVVTFDRSKAGMWIAGGTAAVGPIGENIFDSSLLTPSSTDGFLSDPEASTAWQHLGYAKYGPGCFGTGQAPSKNKIDQGYSQLTVFPLDGATGAAFEFPPDPAGADLVILVRTSNNVLVSKPFYNRDTGRTYAWCSTNMNVANAYESMYLLDLFAMDGTSSYEIGPPVVEPEHEFLQPPHLAAVMDVGSSVSTLMADTYDYWSGQNVPAIDGGAFNTPPAFLFSYPRVERQPTYKHGEAIGDSGVGALVTDPPNWTEDGFPGCSVRMATTTFNQPITAANVEDGVSVISGGNFTWYAGAFTEELGYVELPAFDHFFSVPLWAYNLKHTGVPDLDTPWPLDRGRWITHDQSHFMLNTGGVGWTPVFAQDNPPSDTINDSPATFKFKYTCIWECIDEKGYTHRSSFVPFLEAVELRPGASNTYTGAASGITTGTGWPQGSPVGAITPWFFGPTIENHGVDCHLLVVKTNGATNRWRREVSARFYRDYRGNALFTEVNVSTVNPLSNVDPRKAPPFTYMVDSGRDLTTAVNVEVTAADEPSWNTDGWLRKCENPGGKLLYTTGGVIENVIPEGARYCRLINDRLWLGGFAGEERLQFSKSITPPTTADPKIAPEFNEGFSVASPGDLTFTAVEEMDDKVVVFTEDSIYVVAGTGPNSQGAANNFSPLTVVSSDTGCIDGRSTVLTPNGVMFMGKSGIHLLTRGLGVQFIGEPARDITNEFGQVTSAVLVPKKTQVRFTLIPEGATAFSRTPGTILVYDYRVNQWMNWDVNDGALEPVGFGSACLHNDVYYAMDAHGQVWKQDETVWLDDSLRYYSMKVTTAWLQAAQQSGWQRIYRATALCEKVGVMGLTMTVENDFLQNDPQVVTWSDPDLSSFPNTPVMQPMIHVRRQKCQAVRITIEDIPDPSGLVSAGQGFTIAGFTLEVGLKRGMVKVAKAQRS